MLVLKTILGIRTALENFRATTTLGFVPTMGALHAGHASLINRAKADNNLVVVSVFVNPLQFSVNEDFGFYPRKLDEDLRLCGDLGVDFVFIPSATEMGISSEKMQTNLVPPENLIANLCGPFRSEHFTGVATIVGKLFNVIRPTVAYFGEKDFQQVVVVKQLVKDLNFPIIIKSCPTIREVSGLALSSRNNYLSDSQKEEASNIYSALKLAKRAFENGERTSALLMKLVSEFLEKNLPTFKIQYLQLVNPESLAPINILQDHGLLAIAGHLESIRLIDNILLSTSEPIITIDGPAGAGKSTVTRTLAQQLNFLYLDTGAMYRSVAWLLQSLDIPFDDHPRIAEALVDIKIELIPMQSLKYPCEVYINQKRITEEIRSLEVTSVVSQVAAIPCVRNVLVKLQKEYGKRGRIIAEGRDMGTEVFPAAQLKIFLTASATQRAKRRQKDLEAQGINTVDLAKLTEDIEKRDYQDSNRAISPLRMAHDAIEINTDNLSLEQVCEKISNLYISKNS